LAKGTVQLLAQLKLAVRDLSRQLPYQKS